MGRPTADDGRKVVDRLRGVRHNSSPRLEYLRITLADAVAWVDVFAADETIGHLPCRCDWP